jgi:hypothetical protein
MGVSKTIKFGPAIAPPVTSHPPSATTVTSAGGQSPGPQSAGKPAIRRPYSLLLSLNASNVLNRANQGNPIGNMSSPSFLKSVGATNFFSFGPGGGAGGNRQITLRVRLSF